MSSSYVTEPVTRGKVVLQTTRGPVDIELWARESPLAARNFVQLALDGYYDNTVFHRLVPNFILQGGDPTGTGHGGESASGEKLPVETHQRLRFARRGLVALADGGSQFFFTLDKTPELQGRHTIFGRVAGDTLFNVLDMADQPTDASERPVNPPRILGAEIVENPFDDIVPRDISAMNRSATAKTAAEPAAPKARKATKRSLAMLSFGDEETPLAVPAKKKKPTPSAIPDAEDAAALPPPKRKAEPAAPAPVVSPTRTSMPPPSPRKRTPQKAAPPSPAPVPAPAPAQDGDDLDFAAAMRKQIQQRAELLAKSNPAATAPETKTPAAPANPAASAAKPSKPAKPDPSSAVRELEKAKLAAKQRAKARSGGDILAALASFRSKLHDAPASPSTPSTHTTKDLPACVLHSVPGCLSCTDSFSAPADGDAAVSDAGWLAHRLKFDKDHLGKDLRQRTTVDDDGYMVLDPRAGVAALPGLGDAPAPSAKALAARGGGGGREWDRERPPRDERATRYSAPRGNSGGRGEL
ncbi:Peptidyl-prolyl isomerase cwc27 [Blastocladiella emersonii ATCC 22665]|nr:Peptidyl-prolyl isomerase cwc27 [Blastocladiella emersonii ATCC 22665]